MKKRNVFILLIFSMILGSSLWADISLADWDDFFERESDEYHEHDDDDKKEHEGFIASRGHKDKHSSRYMEPIDNSVYRDECSSCHFLYFPGLLPSGSWEKIMDDTHNHFGEDLFLEEETIEEIKGYLLAYSAEKSKSKRSRKIVRNLGDNTPLRITEIPLIKREHRGIRAKVLKRESVGSLSNCDACHKTAAQGDFDEDNVRIPR
jgi:hypothetical protein